MAATRYVSTICSLALSLVFLASAAGAGWDPVRFAKESTLDFLTVSPDDGEIELRRRDLLEGRDRDLEAALAWLGNPDQGR